MSDPLALLNLAGVRLLVVPEVKEDVVFLPCCGVALVHPSVVESGRMDEAVDLIMSLASEALAAAP